MGFAKGLHIKVNYIKNSVTPVYKGKAVESWYIFSALLKEILNIPY